MGSGSWSQSSYNRYVSDNGVSASSAASNFVNQHLSDAVNTRHFSTKARTFNTDIQEAAKAIGVRQCCENEEHPISTPIIIVLDVTGSMRTTPHRMLTEQFPNIMNALTDKGVPNPQVLFMAVGDCYGDDYPIQVTQFESNPELLLKQLQEFVLEGGGCGNGGESYSLAHIVAGYHTECDAWYKRGQKGHLITVGDEPNHPEVPGWALEKYLGYEHGAHAITAAEALEKALEQYNVDHIHIDDGAWGFNTATAGWKELLGAEHVHHCKSSDICETIVGIITKGNTSTPTEPTSSETFDMSPA